MKKTTRWVGLDVHAETIAVAVAEKDGTVHSVGTIPNRPEAVRRSIKKLESGGKLHVCYEAGPCGYGLYWLLAEMGIECDVVAPTLIPVKTGDRVKTDRRDEVKRARERIERLEKAIDAGIARAPKELQELIAALQTLRGVAKIGAATLVTEVGRFSRFESARQLMAYVGVVPSEHSSGGSTHRGSISKTGNARMRHVVGEAAWSYRHRPANGPALRKRQEGQHEDVKAIAWKAQHRLHQRFQKLSAKSKHHGRVVTAISRELLGFVWAIGCKLEKQLDAA